MTLAELTTNNTSASSSFQGFPSLNVARPGNISKVPLPLPKQKILVHRCDWWGFPGHPNIGHRVDDPAYISRAVTDMRERGIYGAVLDWYGKGSHEDTAALLMRAEAEKQGFKLCICVDKGVKQLQAAAGPTGKGDCTQAMLDVLGYIGQVYFPSASYLMHTDGRPLVFFFGTGSYAINWAQVKEQVATWKYKPLFIFREASAFDLKHSDGGFAWVSSSNEEFYTKGLASKKIVVGSLNPSFNNTDFTLCPWGKTNPHKIDQRGGLRWAEQIKLANKYSDRVHYFQIVTWNDYQEGSPIEPGLDGLAALTARIEDGLLKWNAAGGPEVVDHYEIYAGTSDSDLRKVLDVFPPDAAAGVNPLQGSVANGVGAGVQRFYVKAVGINSMKNRVSPVVRGEVKLQLVPAQP